MRYCKNCGSEMPNEAIFCGKCGTSASAGNGQSAQNVSPTQPVQSTQAYSYDNTRSLGYQKTNGLALVGFILSLLGFSVISLFISIGGLSQVKQSQTTQMPEGGKGLAIAGIVISSLAIFIIAICVVIYIIQAPSYSYYY